MEIDLKQTYFIPHNNMYRYLNLRLQKNDRCQNINIFPLYVTLNLQYEDFFRYQSMKMFNNSVSRFNLVFQVGKDIPSSFPSSFHQIK
jgi:hypothetical protein